MTLAVPGATGFVALAQRAVIDMRGRIQPTIGRSEATGGKGIQGPASCSFYPQSSHLAAVLRRGRERVAEGLFGVSALRLGLLR